MMSLEKVLARKRLCLALTGLTPDEFCGLVPAFEEAWQAFLRKRYRQNPDRRRKPGGGNTPFAPAPREKLFYVLWYHKCYPTYDVAGFFYDRDRANVFRAKEAWAPILESALGKKLVLPKRQIRSPEEFIEAFPEAKEVFIDGSERPVERPKNKEKQAARYSGKKKRHTIKNIIVSDRRKRIGVVTKTEAGKTHDLAVLRGARLVRYVPVNVRIRLDSGFQGLEKEFPGHLISLPAKKPRGRPLAETLKKRNRRKGRIRVLVEHAIGGAKRFRILKDVFRNKRESADDMAMLIGCGLWNYHLAHAR